MVSLNFFCLWETQKKRCWACGSLAVIRWGIQSGKQRFKCKNCDLFFIRNDPDQRLENRFIWFRKWILERQTFKTLSRDSHLSMDTLQRIFYTYLKRSPTVKILKRGQVHLRMDATYFKCFCLLCYQDHEDGYTQLTFKHRANFIKWYVFLSMKNLPDGRQVSFQGHRAYQKK